jgi:hypothetical protein
MSVTTSGTAGATREYTYNKATPWGLWSRPVPVTPCARRQRTPSRPWQGGRHNPCERLFLVRTRESVTRSSDGSSIGFAGSVSELEHSRNWRGVDHYAPLVRKSLITVRYRLVGTHLMQP